MHLEQLMKKIKTETKSYLFFLYFRNFLIKLPNSYKSVKNDLKFRTVEES